MFEKRIIFEIVFLVKLASYPVLLTIFLSMLNIIK